MLKRPWLFIHKNTATKTLTVKIVKNEQKPTNNTINNDKNNVVNNNTVTNIKMKEIAFFIIICPPFSLIF